jgi:thiosulfate reductase cytochrome b subunit
MSIREVMIFSRFERFWHWSQMALIFTLLYTGFNVHGYLQTMDFRQAAQLHTLAALALILLWIFAIFWHLTTGAWRNYLPTKKGLWAVARYYAWGIFKGEQHPYRKHLNRKHNPLQALSYLALKLMLFPAIWVSGLLYLFYQLWQPYAPADALGWVALVHVAAALAILAFVIIHVYLLTTGESFREHVKPMITGFDKVELTPEEEAYLEKDEPGHIR